MTANCDICHRDLPLIELYHSSPLEVPRSGHEACVKEATAKWYADNGFISLDITSLPDDWPDILEVIRHYADRKLGFQYSPKQAQKWLKENVDE